MYAVNANKKETIFTGGAFGSKLNVYAEEALAVALALRLGAPVRWVEDRSEHALATAHGRGQTQDFEVAARADGTILAVRVSLLVSMGAYLQLESPGIPILGRLMFGGQYGAEAYGFDSVAVFTNEPRDLDRQRHECDEVDNADQPENQPAGSGECDR